MRTFPRLLSTVLLALSISLPVLAQEQPVFTSMEPSHLPYSGGTVVLRGRNLSVGFCGEFCNATPLLSIGYVEVAEPERLVVRIEPHRLGTVTLQYEREDAVGAVVPFSLTFTGSDEAALLLPVILPEGEPGAHGSRWATSLRRLTGGQTFSDFLSAVTVPAALIWPRRTYDWGSLHLRLRDLNREDASWGTEIPVVRESEMHITALDLVEVPSAPGYRISLRIYTHAPSGEARHAAEFAIVILPLSPCCSGAIDPIQKIVTVPAPSPRGSGEDLITGDPGYYAVHDLLAAYPQLLDSGPLRIVVRRTTVDEAPPLFWAMASVTHNETQHVTLVTPAVGD